MLKINNLTKKFNERIIIDNLSFEVENSEILTIVGPSGAGKTTLLRCISGLESFDSGEFYLDGKKFNPYEDTGSESVIGVVFQDYQLFPNLTVLDNVTLAPQMVLKQSATEAKQSALKRLSRLQLDGKENLYPYQLSGGQKQRVAIARALAMQPKILCYDEPTSALDPELRGEVSRIIKGLKQDGMTQIVVTHDMDFANDVADKQLHVVPVK
ncbi:amino acid ABC transporter ATP-binding protein [Pediococcus ethanolidurans]|uniref:amino acid ABC transporter ATP-binding protein n=1 Tax=Pediococcus ethanolidurans TaxID=319653 RepID=UPI001C1ED488|nr:amino acid ABC transporter ATP-binding protein [Pediococcus ethanolidurans]MBU7554270.1 amino acid ABC transporter ATP-binding protein [Pediococcus ethanolidurans]MBU7562566.1 amino acid ABC transporter ATP-binding protein [Pediococcus ethanolidurans]MCT4397401.1 amino acid ABC transporter ATP-binding protein [Pediococcus ethanolidurans]MCV3321151.1 amino acid ABC transporter ATP-binding protein [Pediococcus ethanolidurans]MCV3323100.1 amino acid ABC transporter ATP-binding protein [Pedioco